MNTAAAELLPYTKPRRSTAWHESGHAVMAGAVGCDWNVYMQERPGIDIAHTRYFKRRGVCLVEPSSWEICLIGFAGAVAELAGIGEVDLTYKWEANPWQLDEYGCVDDLSVSDLEAIRGHRQQQRAFRKCVNTLHRHLSDVAALASYLEREDYASRYLFETEVRQ